MDKRRPRLWVTFALSLAFLSWCGTKRAYRVSHRKVPGEEGVEPGQKAPRSVRASGLLSGEEEANP